MSNALEMTVNAPDPYTQSFYREITGRAAEKALATRDHRDQIAILAAMVKPVGKTVPAELGDDVSVVVAQLFPRGPFDAELFRRSSDFVDYWGDEVEAIDRDVLPSLERFTQVADRITTS
jgi:hypothetical protein